MAVPAKGVKDAAVLQVNAGATTSGSSRISQSMGSSRCTRGMLRGMWGNRHGRCMYISLNEVAASDTRCYPHARRFACLAVYFFIAAASAAPAVLLSPGTSPLLVGQCLSSDRPDCQSAASAFRGTAKQCIP